MDEHEPYLEPQATRSLTPCARLSVYLSVCLPDWLLSSQVVGEQWQAIEAS